MQKKCPSLGSAVCRTCSLWTCEGLPEKTSILLPKSNSDWKVQISLQICKNKCSKKACKLWSPTQESHTSSSSHHTHGGGLMDWKTTQTTGWSASVCRVRLRVFRESWRYKRLHECNMNTRTLSFRWLRSNENIIMNIMFHTLRL